MTRGTKSPLLDALENPERLLRRRVIDTTLTSTSLSRPSPLETLFEDPSSASDSASAPHSAPPSPPAPTHTMGDQDTRTLADYNRSNMDDVQSSISWGNLPVNNFELSAPQIQLIINTVKFHGLPSESPHRHLAKFMHVSLNLKVNGVPQDEIRLRLFPYTLSGRAEEWLASLPLGSITTWKQMTDRFLEEYFPPKKTAQCREEILSFKQYGTETLNECWIRFKDLLRVCPHHGIPIIQLMDKFYNG